MLIAESDYYKRIIRFPRLPQEGQVLAGGPVAGTIALALIIKVESVQELDELCESLPLWPVMETRIVPLQTFSGQRTAVQSRLKSLRELVASMKS